MRNPLNQDSSPRARHSLRLLVLIAVAASGFLTTSLGAPVGPRTGLRVAVSGLILAGAVTLAARILVAVERARRQPCMKTTAPPTGVPDSDP